MIYVCDSIMGSGKTSAAITYMNEHPEKRYLYATPYLSECKRIKAACPTLHFAEPSGKVKQLKFSKVNHIAQLIEVGQNIVTTHQALKMLPREVSEMIQAQGYVLILDECVQVMEDSGMSLDDLKIAQEAGLVELGENGYYRRTEKEYHGTMFAPFFKHFECGNLFNVGNAGMFYWFLAPEIFASFKKVIVMTYMMAGQPLCYYLQTNHFKWDNLGVQKRNGVYRFCMAEDADKIDFTEVCKHLHIVDNSRLNNIGNEYYALSMTWYERNPDEVKKLKGHLRGFFEKVVDRNFRRNLWATYSTAINTLKGKGYGKSHLAFNARAMNDYSDRTFLAYTVNLFMNATESSFYKGRGYPVDNDAYALSTMLQWIWRSAIRNGEDVTLYLPSRRMRELLYQWMESVNGGVYFDEETEAS